VLKPSHLQKMGRLVSFSLIHSRCGRTAATDRPDLGDKEVVGFIVGKISQCFLIQD